MNRRRIFTVISVRIGMAAVILGFIFTIAGCSLHTNEDSEQSEKNGQADESGLPEENTPTEVEEIDLEADVKTADMYMEEAQAYIEVEDYLAAIEVLMKGVEETEDVSLAEKEQDLREHIIIVKEKKYEYGILREESVYDKAGNMTEKTDYESDGNILFQYQFLYDEKGNKTRCTEYSTIGGAEIWYVHEYDENGNEIEMVTHSTNGISRTEYEHDGAGNCTKKAKYDTSGNLEICYEFMRDEVGRTTQTLVYDDEGIVYKMIYKYEQSEEGSRCRIVSYDGDGKIFDAREEEYNKAGNCTKYIYAMDDSNMYTTRECEYDEAENKIKEVYYNSDGSIEYWKEYEYDEEGNEVKCMYYNELGEFTSGWEYEYNEAGKLIKETELEGKGRIREWSYDTFGNLVEAKENGEVHDSCEYEYVYIE